MPAVIKGQEAEIPRLFRLVRHHDITGVSGTGMVAWGVQFPNGKVVLVWNTDTPAVAVWDSLEAMLEVHGHQGSTVVEWLDTPPVVVRPLGHDSATCLACVAMDNPELEDL